MVKRLMKDYGQNKITIKDYPQASVFPAGNYAGCPCVEIEMGDKITLTNEELRDYLNSEFPLRDKVHFTNEPTLYPEQIWSFVKYYRRNSDIKRRWHITTDGNKKYTVKLLYEVNNILINVQTPHNNMETAPEFISWCCEDRFIKNKVEFLFQVYPEANDISFARYESVKLGSYRKNITLQPIGDWQSYSEFTDEFLNTMRYPHIRLMPNMQEVLGVIKVEL